MIEAVEETVSKLVDSNVASLGLGGDHLTTYPTHKAHAKKHGPLSLIHFDAHADLTEAPCRDSPPHQRRTTRPPRAVARSDFYLDLDFGCDGRGLIRPANEVGAESLLVAVAAEREGNVFSSMSRRLAPFKPTSSHS